VSFAIALSAIALLSASTPVNSLIMLASCFASPPVVVEFASLRNTRAILFPAMESFISFTTASSLMFAIASSERSASALSSSLRALSITCLCCSILLCASFAIPYSGGSFFFKRSFTFATIDFAVQVMEFDPYTAAPSEL